MRSTPTSRIRRTARPLTGRPSTSRCRPSRLVTGRRKGFPLARNLPTRSASCRAMSGASHASKAAGAADAVSKLRSPSMSGSQSGPRQAMTACDSMAERSSARSRRRRSAAISALRSFSRRVHRRRAATWASAVIVENRMRPAMSASPAVSTSRCDDARTPASRSLRPAGKKVRPAASRRARPKQRARPRRRRGGGGLQPNSPGSRKRRSHGSLRNDPDGGRSPPIRSTLPVQPSF